jgi:hypothetical protein
MLTSHPPQALTPQAFSGGKRENQGFSDRYTPAKNLRVQSQNKYFCFQQETWD